MADRPEFNDDFVDVLRAFADSTVGFVIGVHALAAHGVVRATGDLDPCVVDAPLAFGGLLSVHGVTADDFARLGPVSQLGLPPRRVDGLTSISGVTYEVAVRSAVAVHTGSAQLRVPGADALLANTRASARPKDLGDAHYLDAILSDPRSG